MRALRNLILFLILAAAAAGAIAVAFIDPPIKQERMETPVTLPIPPETDG